MSFADVSVIIDGALDQQEDVTSEKAVTKIVDDVRSWSEKHPTQRAEIYVLWHQHSPDIECECIQYVTDHHPQYAFGPEVT